VAMRLGALSGILWLVFSLGGLGLLAAGGFNVPSGSSVDSFAALASAVPPMQVHLGLYLHTLSSLLLVVFAARVWATLRLAERSPAWLSTAAFGAALLAAAGTTFTLNAVFAAIAVRAGHGLDAQTTATLYEVARGGYATGDRLLTLFAGLASIVVLRTRVLPRWLGWLGAIAGVLGIVGRAPGLEAAGELALGLGLGAFYLWSLALAVTLLVRRES
jgi:hypothetical protein